MQKKLFLNLNIILLALLLACTCIYDTLNGSLAMKGTTAGCFVALGFVNLLYACLTRPRSLPFPVTLTAGLVFAMLGDLLLGFNFILGAGLFAIGHVLYAAAMYLRQHFSRLDALCSLGMLLVAAAFMCFTPNLNLGGMAMTIVCSVYAVIISLMAGKAVSCFWRERTLTNALLALGSVLFFISDMMLVLAWFAGAGGWADTTCLYTYFPGQGLLGHSVFHHVSALKRKAG